MNARVLPMAQPLACQEVVAQVATQDPVAQADLVLDVAIKEAIQFLRRRAGTEYYRITRAELLLERAEASAARILGKSSR